MATERRRSRIGAVLRWGAGLLAALLALAALGLWLFRVPAFQAALPILSERLAGLSLTATVEAVETDRLTISTIALAVQDAEPAITLDRLTLEYTLGELIEGRIKALSADGLTLGLAITDSGAVAVDGLPPPSGAADGPPSLPDILDRLPRRLTLRDAEVRARTPIGPRTIALEADVTLPPIGATAPIAAKITADDGFHTASLALSMTAEADRLRVSGDGALDLAVWGLYLPRVAKAAGRIEIDLEGEAPVTLDAPLRDIAGLLPAVEATARLRPTDVTAEIDGLGTLSLDNSEIALSLADGEATLEIPDGLEARLPHPPERLASRLRDAVPAAADAPMALSVPAGWRAAVRPDEAGGWEADAAAVTLTAGPLTVQAAGAARRNDSGALSAEIADGATVTLRPSRLAKGLRLRRPMTVALRAPATLRLGKSGALDVRAIARIEDIALTLPDGRMADVFLPRLEGTWHGGPAKLSLSGAAAHLPDLDLTITETRAELSGGLADGIEGRVILGELVRAGTPVIHGPVSIAGDVRPADDGGWRARTRVTAVEGALAADLDVTLPATGPPRLRFQSDPIRYNPDGLQPGRIAPLLEGIFREATGALSLAADLALGADGPAGPVTVTLDDIGFSAGAARIAKLSGTLTADAAHLPATTGDQTLTAEIDLADLPLGTANLTFALDEAARLTVNRLTVRLFGGEMLLRDATYDPASKHFEGRLQLDAVSLDRALAALEIDGVSGTGTLNGTLPLSFQGTGDGAPGTLRVIDGRIAAAGPGRLAIDNPALAQTLGGQHETVGMMVEALEDFRYDDLGATLEVGEDGTGTLGLTLLGHNPALLEGQPFDLNIAIETDFAKLFGTAREAFGLTDTLLDRLAGQRR